MKQFRQVIDDALGGRRIGRQAALGLAGCEDLPALMAAAAELRDRNSGALITYSPKVFIPLTELCRDVCRYCTFAKTPRRLDHPYLEPEQVLEIARKGVFAGCTEALFTLGERPELRYATARTALRRLGCESTIEYLAKMAELVWKETGLLPHLNPGTMSRDEIRHLRPVAASMGLMLESSSIRLCEKGGPHFGSPDKHPGARLATLARAGDESVPLTSGILVGIGETRSERIDSLLALRELQDAYGHLQEIIIQNFRAKEGTAMSNAPEPDVRELQWTIAVARLLFDPAMSIQAPPNLSPDHLPELIDAGINDWGGISPVTRDHVNPEAPWPELQQLSRVASGRGKILTARLPLYPRYIADLQRWVDPRLHATVMARSDATGLAREHDWSPGLGQPVPPSEVPGARVRIGKLSAGLSERLRRAQNGGSLSESELSALFEVRDQDFQAVCRAADELRQDICGDVVTYVVNRNINYTNVCKYHCTFCAFSKGGSSRNLRGPGYNMPLDEIRARSLDAWHRGATEVCLQGGIHPSFTGQTYLDITSAISEAVPEMHIHAFSALEIAQGAATLGMPVEEFLLRLRSAGLGSMPGTAAEILDDEVRAVICPDKLSTDQWLEIARTAHRVGIPTTSTIMFGHIEQPVHWARHLLRLRDLQRTTRGFTEFVPLPFVHMHAPMFRRGQARKGPTFREVVLMHAIARLVFNEDIPNIQGSWVKLGSDGIAALLNAGVNDLGGTLMNESISRAAGASHGQELTADELRRIIVRSGRTAQQRTTLYELPTMRGPVECHQAPGIIASIE